MKKRKDEGHGERDSKSVEVNIFLGVNWKLRSKESRMLEIEILKWCSYWLLI